MPKKTAAELRYQAAELTEVIQVLQKRVNEFITTRKAGDPLPLEITIVFARLLRSSSELHDALDDLAAIEGR